jgi:hypothetical protein
MSKIRGRESARAKYETQQLLPNKETDAPAKTKLTNLNRTESSISTSKPLISNKPGTYCPGALRLQQGTQRHETLTLDDDIVQKRTKSSRSSEEPGEEELVSEEDKKTDAAAIYFAAYPCLCVAEKSKGYV